MCLETSRGFSALLFWKINETKKRKGVFVFYGSCIPPLLVVPCLHRRSLIVPKTSTMLKLPGL